jgi:hypothetical protein
MLCAFDLIELDGADLRRAPIEHRKHKLSQLVRTPRPGIVLYEHYDGEGDIVFKYACKLRLRRHRFEAAWLPVSVGMVCALGEGEKSQSASCQTRGRRGLGPVNVTERKTKVILVECLTCRHEGMIHERDLARFGLKPGTPISRFVKNLTVADFSFPWSFRFAVRLLNLKCWKRSQQSLDQPPPRRTQLRFGFEQHQQRRISRAVFRNVQLHEPS